MKREAKASGTSPSFSELDQLIEECLEVVKLAQDLRQKDGRKARFDFCFDFSGASYKLRGVAKTKLKGLIAKKTATSITIRKKLSKVFLLFYQYSILILKIPLSPARACVFMGQMILGSVKSV